MGVRVRSSRYFQVLLDTGFDSDLCVCVGTCRSVTLLFDPSPQYKLTIKNSPTNYFVGVGPRRMFHIEPVTFGDTPTLESKFPGNLSI